MKLSIMRDQVEKIEKAGFMSKKKNLYFKLTCVLHISPEEKNLINKYEMADWPIAEKDSQTPYLISDLEQGIPIEHSNLAFLQEYEQGIQDKLTKLKNYIEVAENYKGAELEIEI